MLRALIASLHRAAKQAFPNAEIYMPLLNISQNASTQIQDNVASLNDLMMERFLVIPPLPLDAFTTQGDNIKWTTDTGKAMWKHWRTYLS